MRKCIPRLHHYEIPLARLRTLWHPKTLLLVGIARRQCLMGDELPFSAH